MISRKISRKLSVYPSVQSETHASVHKACVALRNWLDTCSTADRSARDYAAIVNHADRAAVRVTLARREVLIALTIPESATRAALETFNADGSLLVLTTGGTEEFATTLDELSSRWGNQRGAHLDW